MKTRDAPERKDADRQSPGQSRESEMQREHARTCENCFSWKTDSMFKQRSKSAHHSDEAPFRALTCNGPRDELTHVTSSASSTFHKIKLMKFNKPNCQYVCLPFLLCACSINVCVCVSSLHCPRDERRRNKKEKNV